MAALFALESVTEALFALSFDDALRWSSYGLALAIYIILIFNFYRFVAKRDIFEQKLTFAHPGVVGLLEDFVLAFLRLIKYGVMFPIISFVWFVGFVVLLFVVTQNQPIQQITLIAIALITGARILSYYNEDAAQELAKTVAIVILGTALVQPDFFQFTQVYQRLLSLPALSVTLLHFIVYLSGLELLMRFLYHLKLAVFNDPISQKKISNTARPPLKV